MARRREPLKFFLPDAAVSARADAHPARPAPRRKRTYQFERLEDRLLMTADSTLLATDEYVAQAGTTLQSAPAPTLAQRDEFNIWSDTGEVTLDVLGNDSGDDLRIIAARPPWIGGALTISDDGRTLRYTPPFGMNTSVYFDYTVRGADGVSRTMDVFATMRPRFRQRNDSYSVDLNSPEVSLDVLSNDHINDPSIDPRVVAIEQPAEGGTFFIPEDGKSLRFKPGDGFQGSVSASYSIRFGPNEHDVAQGYVSISVSRPFLAIDDWFEVDPAGGPQSLDVLKNEFLQTRFNDVRSMTRELRIVSVSAGEHGGQLAIAADGKSLVYEAADGFSGDERITYEIEDQFGNRDQAQITVNVRAGSPSAIATYQRAEWEVRLLERAAQHYNGLFGTPAASGQSLWYLPYIYCGDIDSDFVLLRTNDLQLYAASDAASKTNVQVAGVDEADLVETDGRYIYAFSDGKLTILDVQDPNALRLVSMTDLATSATAMFLDGGRLSIVGQSEAYETDGKYVVRTTLTVFDVTNASAPTLVQRTELDGRLAASRSVDGRVHLVLNQELLTPVINTVEILRDDGSKSLRYETWEEYVDRVRSGALEDALPQFKSFDANGQMVAAGVLSNSDEIVKAVSTTSRGLVSVVVIDMRSDVPGPTDTVTWRDEPVQPESVYMSRDSLYVWSNQGPWGDSLSTSIRKIDIRDPQALSFAAQGTIDGRVVDQFSFDEHDGNLRVVTTSPTYAGWRLTAEDNDLYVLEQEGAELKVVGHAANFADGESVRSVRFDGDRALVVTFPDQIFDPTVAPVDPLFVIDLSDPAAPTVERELEVPGYSTYLQLINDDQLLGFGADIDPETGENHGVILSLFRAAGLDQPEILDQFRFELDQREGSIALDDHRAIAFYPELQIVTVPIVWTEPLDDLGWRLQTRGELWVLKINQETGEFELISRVSHETPALRSLRVGEVLFALSGDTLTSHSLARPHDEVDRLYFGSLPQSDQFTHTEDSGPWTLDVLANDRLTEIGEHATIVSVTQPNAGGSNWIYLDASWSTTLESAGTVEIAADGKSLIFTPRENFFGTATFTYTVFDEIRGEQTATVTLIVSAVPDAPDAVNDEYDVELGATAVPLNVLANDVNFDVQAPFHYIPLTDIDVMTRPILAVDDLAVSGSYALMASRSIVVSDVAWYPYVMPFKITSVSLGDHGGSVSIDEFSQQLFYTPAAGFEGIETFTYTIETAAGLTDTATVTVRVGAVPEVPLLKVAQEEVSQSALTQATGPAAFATERETAPAELANPDRPSRVVAPPVNVLDIGAVARPGAVVSARPLRAGPTRTDFLATSFRSLDSINLSHLASFRSGQNQSTTDLAFAELNESENGVAIAECDLDCLVELQLNAAEI